MHIGVNNLDKIDPLIINDSNPKSCTLLDPTTGGMLITNRVGRRIIELVDGTRDLPAIIGIMQQEYSKTPTSRIADRVSNFMKEAIKKGIVFEAKDIMDGTRVPVPQNAQPIAIGSKMRERAKLRVVNEDKRKFRPSIYWYLSFRCNLACKHCSVQSSPWVDTSEDLTTEECLAVVEQMAELNVGTAMLSGGEVLLRHDALEILSALREKRIFVGLETNGLRFDRAFAELALEMQSEKLLDMTISLDGGTKETHELMRGKRTFDRTVRGLRFLKENGIRFNVQCVLNGFNYLTIPNLYELARELSPNFKEILWSVLNPIGRGIELVEQDLGLKPEQIDHIFELIRADMEDYDGKTMIKFPPAMIPPKHLAVMLKSVKIRPSTSCLFPLLGVLPNGTVSICAMSRDNQDLNFGNVRNVSLKEVWERTRMSMLRSHYLGAEELQGICGDCIWKHTCKGSCRAWAYEEGGSFDAAFPVCQAMAENNMFPQEYRLSYQNGAVADHYRNLGAGAGCSCSA